MKKVKILTIVLAIILVTLIAFGGIYLPTQNRMENKVKEIKLTAPKKVIKKEENVKLKSEVISKTKEYKQLMKECNEKLALAMENAENDMQGFNNTLQEIKSKIAAFFSKTE